MCNCKQYTISSVLLQEVHKVLCMYMYGHVLYCRWSVCYGQGPLGTVGFNIFNMDSLAYLTWYMVAS